MAASLKGGTGDDPLSLCFPADSQRDFGQRPGSAYVTDEIWRKAGKDATTPSPSVTFRVTLANAPPHRLEEAVNEVKRQAMDEVQKAVAEAEQKAFEMIATERAKMEKTLAEAKRKAQEDAIMIINEQEDSSEVSGEKKYHRHRMTRARGWKWNSSLSPPSVLLELRP